MFWVGFYKRAAIAAETDNPTWDKGDITENLQEDNYRSTSHFWKGTADMTPSEDARDLSDATSRDSGYVSQNPYFGR